MTYEYKGTLPLEEQRATITKLIEELAEKMGSSVADYYLRPWLLSHKERRKNILYVYGYGGSHLSSSVEKLRRELPKDKFKVMCWGRLRPESAE
ncbi:MAG: hypothetical protein KBT12_03510 [Bacteroidales bacterium]|nr:hypothetical protein [Candidatus Physcousia equi]